MIVKSTSYVSVPDVVLRLIPVVQRPVVTRVPNWVPKKNLFKTLKFNLDTEFFSHLNFYSGYLSLAFQTGFLKRIYSKLWNLIWTLNYFSTFKFVQRPVVSCIADRVPK